jgi:hypothetical protein
MNRRLFSMIGTPILALVAAAVYTEWRAGKTALDVEQFCSAIQPGGTVEEFARLALAQDYKVNDLGAGTPSVMASRVVHGFREEVYGCIAERDDAGHVSRTRTEHRFVD